MSKDRLRRFVARSLASAWLYVAASLAVVSGTMLFGRDHLWVRLIWAITALLLLATAVSKFLAWRRGKRVQDRWK